MPRKKYGRKSYGSSSGRTYKTYYRKGGYYRKSYYKAPRSSISRFQNPGTVTELKNNDVNFAAQALQLSPTFTLPFLVNGVVQGVTGGQRIGRKVNFKSMQYRLSITNGTGIAATPSVTQVRVLVLYDRQTNGALPALTEIFSPTATFDALIALQESKRWVILSDKTYQNDSTAGSVLSIKCFEKMAMETQYNGAGGVVVDVAYGGIYILIAHNGGAFTTAPTVDGNFRLRFTDA